MSSPPTARPADHATTLTAEELRVLACLIEKANTTPDQYPLSTNALTAACNQKTSREPTVDYWAPPVDRVMQLLRDGGWARSIRGTGNRTFKHRHVVDERLGLDVAEQSLVAVLALRGPQSPGELKTRTERYHPFADLEEVEAALRSLADREPPLTRNLGRGPGQSQDRWIQLLGPTPDGASPAAAPSAETTTPGPGHHEPGHEDPGRGDAGRADPGQGEHGPDGDAVAELGHRVTALERRMAELERELGLEL